MKVAHLPMKILLHNLVQQRSRRQKQHVGTLPD